MNPYNLNPNPEALRCLGIAEKLLDARDLVGSKTFATRARESDPGLNETEQVLAVVDTLIAAEKQISNHNLDWYAILQLVRQTHDSELIASRYRRLSLLLNPNRNKFAFADHAFKLVAEAWLVLSNPSRKLQFDNEFGGSGSSSSNAQFNFLQQHYETPPAQQQHHQLNNISTHFNFIQEHSEQLHQSLPMQQQFLPPFPQQLLTQHSVQFINEQQQQQPPLPQQVHWSNQTQQPLFRPQPQQPQLQQHWPQPQVQQSLPRPQPQQQQSFLWTQLEPQPPLRPQPHAQPFLDPRSQSQPRPQKAPPLSREQVDKDIQFNQGENGGNGDNGIDESATFWTTCPYCFNMYEYPGVYAECSLLCQKCRKAFHAVRLGEPPDVADGEDAYFCCWGFVPIGVSASYFEEHKVGTSSWKPFATMFGFPQGGNDTKPFTTMFGFSQGGNDRKPKNVTNLGPRTFVDDDEDNFLDISSNEESDDDWHGISTKKAARSSKRKISTAKKVRQSQVYRGEKVAQSNMGGSQSGVVEGVGVSVPSMGVPTAPEPSVPTVAVRSISNSAMAMLSVPVGETNKKVTGETSTKIVVRPNKKGVAVSTGKQQGKLDLNVEFNNEGEEAAPGTSGARRAGNRVEDNIEGVGFFEGLDEFLNNLPILSNAGDDKVKAV